MFLFSTQCTKFTEKQVAHVSVSLASTVVKKVSWGGEVDLVAVYEMEQQTEWQQQLNKVAAVAVEARSARLTAKVIKAAHLARYQRERSTRGMVTAYRLV